MRTAEDIFAHIERQLGFVPSFFLPAREEPAILENLWDQTLSAYIHNPLPATFKEKLFAYLSRFCLVPYCIVCHSCALRPVGLNAREILALLQEPPPTKDVLAGQLEKLQAQSASLSSFPAAGSALERTLLDCSIWIFLRQHGFQDCQQELRRLLSPSLYKHLIALLAYISTCHHWVEAHPELSYEADRRVQAHFASLTSEEPALVEFFQSYAERIAGEQRHRESQLIEEIEERRRAEEAVRFLAEITTALTSSLDYQTTLSTLAQQTVPSFADWCIVDIVEEDRQIRRVAVAAADPQKRELLVEIQRRYPPDWDSPQPATQVMREGRPLLIKAMRDEIIRARSKDDEHYRLMKAIDPRSSLIVPLLARGHTLGAISFAVGASGRRYSEEHLPLAEELARHAAIAVDNARLYRNAQLAEERMRNQAARLRVLAEASQAFAAASLDLQAVLDAITQHIALLIGDLCIIRLVSEDGQWLKPVSCAHTNPQALRSIHQLLISVPTRTDEGLTALVLQTGEPLLIPDISPEEVHAGFRPEFHPYLEQYGLASLLIVPLQVQNRTIGTLGLGRDRQGHSYTYEDQMLLQDLAGRAALAVDNARLYQEAQQALQTRDQFLSIAAHELRTPVTAILGYAQLLQRRISQTTAFSQRTQQVLQTLVGQIRRLDRLSLALLDLSRIQLGRFALERDFIDVTSLARRITEELQPTLDRHTLVLETSDEPLMVSGDELRLEQVLYNLLQNAIKYSPRGGTIGVTLQRQDEVIRIDVSDQGIGIPAESLPKLFSRFYRASNVNRQQISGMGLGLYVVREIVALHGGTVEVVSHEGVGSVFTVKLPLHGKAYTTSEYGGVGVAPNADS